MNRKTFLTGLAVFYLVSGCGAAWLSFNGYESASEQPAADAALELPSQEAETLAEVPETSAVPEPESEPLAIETEASEPSEEEITEPETSEAETPEETEAVSYTYRAIHQKYRLFIRETPDASANALGYLKPGETGDVLSIDGDWVLVEHNGITGYVSAQFLELTEKPAS